MRLKITDAISNKQNKLFMKKSLRRSLMIAITVVIVNLFLATTASAQKTWDGGAGTANWGDANNWAPDGVPGAGDAVTIGNFASVVINVNAVCASLTTSSVTLTAA